jgi:hypothetical protein
VFRNAEYVTNYIETYPKRNTDIKKTCLAEGFCSLWDLEGRRSKLQVPVIERKLTATGEKKVVPFLRCTQVSLSNAARYEVMYIPVLLSLSTFK